MAVCSSRGQEQHEYHPHRCGPSFADALDDVPHGEEGCAWGSPGRTHMRFEGDCEWKLVPGAVTRSVGAGHRGDRGGDRGSGGQRGGSCDEHHVGHGSGCGGRGSECSRRSQ